MNSDLVGMYVKLCEILEKGGEEGSLPIAKMKNWSNVDGISTKICGAVLAECVIMARAADHNMKMRDGHSDVWMESALFLHYFCILHLS